SVWWSPKGNQVRAGKMNGTLRQYTAALEEKKVIPCPFYTSDEPVKVLDVLWLKTFVFAVVYAAADGSSETPPDLVLISLPKKDEKVETKFLNFSDPVYGNCTERQHHYFLSHVEDWDLVFAASAASMEVSVISRQDDKIWELWMLEDNRRAELPVTKTNEDTLPLGLAIAYTSQSEIHLTNEKILPPVPTMLMLSTEGLLCPFALLNFIPGVKQLVSPPTTLALDGERLSKPELNSNDFTQFRPISGSLVVQPPKSAASITSAPAAFPSLGLAPVAAATLSATAGTFSVVPGAGGSVPSTSSSSSFVFSVTNALSSSTATTSAPFGSGSSGFTFATKPLLETSSAPSAFLFSSIKPSTVVPAGTASGPSLQSIAAPSPPAVKLNLNERFSSLETPTPQSFSFSSPINKPSSISISLTTPSLTTTRPLPAIDVWDLSNCVTAPLRPVQTSAPSAVVQKQGRVQTSQVLSLCPYKHMPMEKQLQEKKDSDPIMAGILEEIAHFQTELDDLKTRSARTDFKVGTTEEMKELRNESENLHIFTLEIKETTESLYGDISTLNTHLLEGFAGAEEAKTQTEMRSNRNYRQLLYKKPLDPRSEEQLKEIRKLYQYVIFAVDDVNDVLDAEWEKHLEKKKKQRHMIVPGRENLYTTLANNQYIINQQKNRLDQLVKELISLRLYNKAAAQTATGNIATSASDSLDSELESLRKALLESKLDSTPPKTKSKSPITKISPAKLSQLRNFLSKGQMPPVRSTAPANLSRSAFLSPKYYEDLDDVSSTSSLSQSLEPHPAHLELEEDELQPEAFPTPVVPPALSTPRHPTVVRTPSIQPGFGAIQSTPLTKIQSGPVPTNKINLSGAESTALATKTVKHGAPPTERAVPVTISAQQAAANAALRRQMATQKTAVIGASLTESTLKTVPQVVNIMELKDKETPSPVSISISSSGLTPTAQVFTTVSNQAIKVSFGFTDHSANRCCPCICLGTQAKFIFNGPCIQMSCQMLKSSVQNPTPTMQKINSEAEREKRSFAFGQLPKTDVSVALASSAEQSSSKGFTFASGSHNSSLIFPTLLIKLHSSVSGFGFASVVQGSQGNGKMVFGQTSGETASAAVSSAASTAPSTASADKPPSSEAAFRVDPQPMKAGGGETLGSFSGLRVGQGEEAKDTASKPAAAGVAQFNFGPILQTVPDVSAGSDLSKGASFGSLFKPPETNTKPFSAPQSSSPPSALSFSSLLAAPSEESKAPPQTVEPTPPPPEKQPAAEPVVETSSALVAPGTAADDAAAETLAAAIAAPLSATTAPAPAPSSSVATPPTLTPSTAAVSSSTTVEAAPDSTTNTPLPAPAAASPAVSQVVPTPAPTPAPPGSLFTQPASTVKDSSSLPPSAPGSLFTQPTIATTDSSTFGVNPVISTATASSSTPAPASVSSTTSTPEHCVRTACCSPGVFSSFSPCSPCISYIWLAGVQCVRWNGFGKPVFGQGNGFGQPASSTGTASSFSFGHLFGASTTSAISFSFGTSTASTASSKDSGLFGQSTAPAFGQSSGFGQGPAFGSNTTTSASTGFSFGQPSVSLAGFGCSAFGQQPSSGGLFGQVPPSSGGSLFGSNPANSGGTNAGGGFFSGLGGKPSEEAANKNPFGASSTTGGFGQQPAANGLFGNSGAKSFGFGQSSFGEQKVSGTFTAGTGSVASQGFGSYSTPAKPGGFGSAPVFGSPPAFGSSPAFGSTASFGQSPGFNNALGSSGGKVFGEGTAASNMGGFGFASPPSGPSFGSLANQATPSFGNLAQQGSGFGSQPNSFSGFGQQPQAGGFSGNTFGSSNQSTQQTFSAWRS
uniref:Nuclear pore complex protein Nup214 phenylalanine-glycine (FG) domain-containing protein n=1 Tax=Tetraodon nigroviridis TaxID=99883 RepID=H3C4U1_TETNG